MWTREGRVSEESEELAWRLVQQRLKEPLKVQSDSLSQAPSLACIPCSHPSLVPAARADEAVGGVEVLAST